MSHIFIQNVPSHLTDRKLRKELEPHVLAAGALSFHVQTFSSRKQTGGKRGHITLPTAEAGRRFLDKHGPTQNPARRIPIPPRVPIIISGQILTCQLNNRPADPYMVKSLLGEEEIRKAKSLINVPLTKKMTKIFNIKTLWCGVWSHTPQNSTPTFIPRYTLQAPGTVRFGGKALHIELEKTQDTDGTSIFAERTKYCVVAQYSAIKSIILNTQNYNADVFFTVREAPRFYREESMEFEDQFLAMQLGAGVRDRSSRKRIPSLDDDHGCFAPFSFVYRVSLQDGDNAGELRQLSKKFGIPAINFTVTITQTPKVPFEQSFVKLLEDLQRFEFRVAFQLYALLANGLLPPETILQIIPMVDELISRFGGPETALILGDFIQDVPISFDTGENWNLTDIHRSLRKRAKHAETSRSRQFSSHSTQAHMTWIHHVTITPAGCYFYGPFIEMQNRVLRKYPNNHDYFLRVTFCDEDGDQFTYEPNVDQHPIYQGQFKGYLTGRGIIIGGRSFKFLGFSSSSLRSQSCWFMAPFDFDGELLNASKVIERLGDFSEITCPGRCAARIGQAFSDTFMAIHVPPGADKSIPELTTNTNPPRCFSDGVGTISQEMLGKIWAASENTKKAQVFQIRFKGAKGVVSLDNRLQGDQLCLRPSMVKFKGSNDRDLEICSGASWLPMVLNRPLIKVLEDLGISGETFLDLQNKAVAKLQRATKSALLAASLLKQLRVSSISLKLPWMVEALHNLGYDFREDDFLEKAFELSLLMALRDLKYRARIPVPQGLTVMGIVDETGFLEEGEIYCAYDSGDAGEGIVGGRVMITRSPIFHPGDVQMARAITDVPANSPLRALKNCVVFSQKGSRDLPSMLSGGDLDGDLYNIVHDERFHLRKTHPSAEYLRLPPVDLKRPVTTADIVAFFIDFMQNNLLALISHKHLIIADQMPEGIFHPDCLKLAEMASTAVDFPKTGIQVNKSEIPKNSKVKPDFMAPGPRILFEKDQVLAEIEGKNEDEDDDDYTSEPKYYKSEKILGELYRAIDEEKFLDDAKAKRPGRRLDILFGLWGYLLDQVPSTCDWGAALDFAVDLKRDYEDCVLDMMTNYSDTPWNSKLEEVEVFIGCIVGKEKQTKRQRENSKSMKEDFDRMVSGVIDDMKGESREETLANAMACLYICLEERQMAEKENKHVPLKSFAWVSASVVLVEVDKIQKEIGRSRG